MAEKTKEFDPTPAQLLKHPLALAAYVPKEAVLFGSSATAAKTFTAPLERIKLLMQVRFVTFFFSFVIQFCTKVFVQ